MSVAIWAKPTPEQEAHHRLVKCPKCGAEPGRPCRAVKSTKTGSPPTRDNPYSHADRRYLSASVKKQPKA